MKSIRVRLSDRAYQNFRAELARLLDKSGPLNFSERVFLSLAVTLEESDELLMLAEGEAPPANTVEGDF